MVQGSCDQVIVRGKIWIFLGHFKILAGLQDVAYTVTVVRVKGENRGLLWSSDEDQSNMNNIVVWAWTLWSAHAVIASTTRKPGICECELSADCSAKAVLPGLFPLEHQEPSDMNSFRSPHGQVCPGARALGAGGAPLITPIILPYIISHITP